MYTYEYDAEGAAALVHLLQLLLVQRVHLLCFGQFTRIGHIPGGGTATFVGGWPD